MATEAQDKAKNWLLGIVIVMLLSGYVAYDKLSLKLTVATEVNKTNAPLIKSQNELTQSNKEFTRVIKEIMNFGTPYDHHQDSEFKSELKGHSIRIDSLESIVKETRF